MDEIGSERSDGEAKKLGVTRRVGRVQRLEERIGDVGYADPDDDEAGNFPEPSFKEKFGKQIAHCRPHLIAERYS